jgi:hypothetical protein
MKTSILNFTSLLKINTIKEVLALGSKILAQ